MESGGCQGKSNIQKVVQPTMVNFSIPYPNVNLPETGVDFEVSSLLQVSPNPEDPVIISEESLIGTPHPDSPEENTQEGSQLIALIDNNSQVILQDIATPPRKKQNHTSHQRKRINFSIDNILSNVEIDEKEKILKRQLAKNIVESKEGRLNYIFYSYVQYISC